MNILGHIVYNNILGNVNVQYTEQDLRTVCIRQDIYNGVIWSLMQFFMRNVQLHKYVLCIRYVFI